MRLHASNPGTGIPVPREHSEPGTGIGAAAEELTERDEESGEAGGLRCGQG